MHAICDIVRPIHDLRFHGLPTLRSANAYPIKDRLIIVVDTKLAIINSARPRVLSSCIQRCTCEIESDRAARFIDRLCFKSNQESEGLCVAFKSPALLRDRVESIFTIVAKGWVADVVCQTGTFHQIWVRA